MAKWTRILLELVKFRIAFFSTLSTSTGFILSRREWSTEIILPILGVFFLASGSCALNQYQEREHDQRMDRTRGRPIPSKKLSPSAALTFSISLLLFGSVILLLGAPKSALGLGLFAMLWYNGFYTLLKRKTAFAAIPGALIGAIPPLIGWVSGKGLFSLDPPILAISFFFFIWQVPHFWLLLLKFGRDYEKAGLPSLSRIFTSLQLSRITFIWIFATAAACMMMPLFGMVESHLIHGSLFFIAFWLLWKSLKLISAPYHPFSSEFHFKSINSYALVVMILLTVDHLFY
ncbi:MAG: protoheme IX farnesyltransferase [Syntrophaceae bacterium]|nr:protoheme IX farnesyltransferase [Syntrophaceae bacterium]